MSTEKSGPTTFRNVVSREAGAQYPPEKGRYHLYVSATSPWAQRTLIIRKLKGLEDIISVDIVDWKITDKGWRFNTADHKVEGATEDTANGAEYIREIYFKTDPNYAGRFTVPALFDKKTKTVVNNESSEILRILNSEFNDLLDEKHAALDFYPKKYQKEIDEINEWVFEGINNGVPKYRTAVSEEEKKEAAANFYKALDRAEEHLKEVSKKNNDPSKPLYLVGDEITEADIRLYPNIVRFDILHVHQINSTKRIRTDYPYIHKWLRHLHWDVPAFHDTTGFDHIALSRSKALGNNITVVSPPVLAKNDE